MMKFQFDPNQQYQLDAVSSVVDLFDGQPSNAETLFTALRGSADITDERQAALGLDLTQEVGAIGNNLVLDHETILQNLQSVQDRNGLEIQGELYENALDFDTEMETGTGKTYVYLRTIFELNKNYNFSKFIILVPSVAIREGVATSVALMREHFTQLYATPFDFSVYSGKSPEDVQSFATSTTLQIMVITIDSLRGDSNTRIIHQRRDRLNDFRPIDFLKATNPVVIMDEPQNMESKLSQSAVGELSPLCTLRYSATHRQARNVVYRLDPVDAHDLGLVKQIVVAEVSQQGADATPYMKLIEVKRDPWQAKLELVCRDASGSLARRQVSVRDRQNLGTVSGNSIYDNYWMNTLSIDPEEVEITNLGTLAVGEQAGGNLESVYREMIRETIREHLRKEAQFREQEIKVLSLFFVDKVASFLGDGTGNDDADGMFVKWFDELFVEERDKRDAYKTLLPQRPIELRRAYFAQLKSKGKTTYVDSTGATQKDDDAYDLIMRDKARLLDSNEPVRFIFSHSALREGWDNPNVFQICALREMGGETERRQTIGRGLRLPVNQDGERVPDRTVAQLTVVANESYQQFAKSLQEDYVRAGVSIGYVRKGEFSKLPSLAEGSDESLGYRQSEVVWQHLNKSGFIDKDGMVLGTFVPNQLGFTLNLPEEFKPLESEIIETVARCKIEHFVKQQRDRKSRVLNKELLLTPEFEKFWHRISRRTTYKVSVDRESVIEKSVKAIRLEEPIQPLRIQVTRAGVKIFRGGAKGEELGTRSANLAGNYELPDIISELQEATSLTRKTIVDILIQSDRLQEFINNPNDFIQMVKRCVTAVLSDLVVEGIQYEQISGSVYELRELQRDGIEERDRFVNQMYKVQNSQKTDFDWIVYDSEVERQFAELLDSREEIKLFVKLPAKFKVPTPVGDYNPDWAIVKHVDGEDRIYMIRETKSTSQDRLLRPIEVAKMRCGRKHFAAIGIEDYAKSSPENWSLE